MLGNACPSHHSPYPSFSHPFSWRFGSLTQLKLAEISPSRFSCCFLHFLHAQNSFFVLLGEWEERSHDFRVLEGHFFHCEQDGSFPHIFSAIFLFTPSWETRFWVSDELEKRPMIFGWLLSPFFPM